MRNGPLAGYPIEDVKVTLTFGSYHDVDSSEMAFKIAGSMAIKDAVKKAKPKLMERIYKQVAKNNREYELAYRNSKAGCARCGAGSGIPAVE